MRRRPWTAAAAAVLAGLALAAPAHAARPAKAVASVVGCEDDRVIVAASIRQSSRAVRGAELRVRWGVVGLFGDDPVREPEVSLGKKRRVVVSKDFKGLPADVYRGEIRYRYVRGRKTVGRGVVRTKGAKVGRRRGRSLCTLSVGKRPEDRVPPVAFIGPDPSPSFVTAPLEGAVVAYDDFSGVAEVAYSINGGAPRSGRRFTLGDGVQTVTYWARDVAGNVSAPKQATYRVDGAPPTAPAVTAPAAGLVTGDTTPTVAWTGSTDNASGVQGYTVVLLDAAGQAIGSAGVGAAARSLDLAALSDGTYGVKVVARDAMGFTSESAVVRFTVDRVVYANDFSGGCSDFSQAGDSPNPWSCASGALSTAVPERCNGQQTYQFLGSALSPGAGTYDFSFSYDFREPSNRSDQGRVEISLDGGGSWSTLTGPYSATAAGNDGTSYSIAAGQTITLRLAHVLSGKTLGGCAPDEEARFVVDDLSILRRP